VTGNQSLSNQTGAFGLGMSYLDPLGADVTNPPDPTVYEEPSYLNPNKDFLWPIAYEGGQTGELERGMAQYESWMYARIEAANNLAEDLAEVRAAAIRGDMTTVQKILERNPNIGIEASGPGGRVTLWGREAAGFLTGLFRVGENPAPLGADAVGPSIAERQPARTGAGEIATGNHQQGGVVLSEFDMFDIGLAPVPKTGQPRPATATTSIYGYTATAGKFQTEIFAFSDGIVRDQYGTRLKFEGNLQITETVVPYYELSNVSDAFWQEKATTSDGLPVTYPFVKTVNLTQGGNFVDRL
jgi:hypothetical protein